MDRRRFLLGSGATFATVFAGCSARDGDGDDDDGFDENDRDDGEENDGSDGATADERDGSEPGEDGVAGDDLETAGFSGSGDETVDDVGLEGGLTVLAATHDGSRRFTVTLVGENEETMIRHVGEYRGAVADHLEGGTYRLEVEADGDWELVLSHPRASSGRALPATLEDDEDDVYGPFSFDGSTTLSGTHGGDGNFIVRVLSPDGEFRQLAINEIDRYEGEESIDYEGVGYVAVRAGGEWSLDLE